MTHPTSTRSASTPRPRWPHMRGAPAWFVVAVLLLAGCGSSADPDAAGSPTSDRSVAESPSVPSGQTGGEGTYTVDLSPPGAGIDATLYAPENHRLVRRLERFRRQIDKLEDIQVGYLLADIDNTEGSSRVTVSSFQVLTNDGAIARFWPVDTLVGEWRRQVDPYDTNTFEQGTALIDFFHMRARVEQGEDSTQIFAAVDPPSEIAEVFAVGSFDTQQMFRR